MTKHQVTNGSEPEPKGVRVGFIEHDAGGTEVHQRYETHEEAHDFVVTKKGHLLIRNRKGATVARYSPGSWTEVAKWPFPRRVNSPVGASMRLELEALKEALKAPYQVIKAFYLDSSLDELDEPVSVVISIEDALLVQKVGDLIWPESKSASVQE